MANEQTLEQVITNVMVNHIGAVGRHIGEGGCPRIQWYAFQNEMTKAISAMTTRPAAPVEGLVDNCDGKEQEAFEAWAKKNNYDMHEHPLHYLFLDAKTYAARQGWNEAIRYCRSQVEAIIAAERAEVSSLSRLCMSYRSDIDGFIEQISDLKAANAALTVRVKELETDVSAYILSAEDQDKRRKALETQLAAARKALTDIDNLDQAMGHELKLNDAFDAVRIARAALEDKS